MSIGIPFSPDERFEEEIKSNLLIYKSGNLLKLTAQCLFTAIYLCPMAKDLKIITGNKAEQYEALLPQIKSLVDGEPDLVANMANIVAALKEQFGWLWVGFYIVKPSTKNQQKEIQDELVLGPFQGPVACTRISKGRGVCGTAWEKATTIIVPDVEKFPGHIACSSLSRSEIVIPVFTNEKVVAILDADSEYPDHFDETDQQYLEQIVNLLQF